MERDRDEVERIQQVMVVRLIVEIEMRTAIMAAKRAIGSSDRGWQSRVVHPETLLLLREQIAPETRSPTVALTREGLGDQIKAVKYWKYSNLNHQLLRLTDGLVRTYEPFGQFTKMKPLSLFLYEVLI